MDFIPSATVDAVREGVREACARFDTEYWMKCDAAHRWPSELWAELATGGWLGLAVPEEFGGGGQGLLELAVAVQEVAAAGAGMAASFLYLLTPGFGGLTISRHGTDEQKRALLPGFARGELRSCFALTEPDAGSNALAITTAARRDGDDFLVRGQKTWISDVERADWMLLVCRTTPAAEATGRTDGFSVLLVEVKEALTAGTLTVAPIPKAGNNVVGSYSVFLDDLRVPGHRVVGEVDQGFAVLWEILNPERILAAACGIGSADLALRTAVGYATERVVFGRPIGANQAVAFPLAKIKAQVELGRLMVHKAAWLFDNGLPCGEEANIAKLTAADAAWRAADRAFQTFGGMAYSEEHPVARLLRDSRIARSIPVSEELVLAHIATQSLGLPRTY
jgi:acyl-CoA dehydrogenase